MLPRRQGATNTAAAAASVSARRTPYFDPWAASSPPPPSSSAAYTNSGGGFFVNSSPSVDSDHTSDDTGDHFDFEDTLALVATRSTIDDDNDDFMIGEGPLPPTVEKAISAVYEEITREEKAERGGSGGGGSIWRELHFGDGDDEEGKRTSREPAVASAYTTPSNKRSGASAARDDQLAADRRVSNSSSSSSSHISEADLLKTGDPGALKRARRSEIEKKSRQRRQGLLRRMRDDVHRLECIYADLLEKKATSGEIDALVRPARRPQSANDLNQMYSRLSVLARTLTDEQSHIRRLLQEHELFQQFVAASSKVPAPVAEHGIPVSRSFDAGFDLLSIADCYVIVRESHEAICRFEESEEFVSTGASFMGWTDRRKFDEVTSALQYGFGKKYPLESAEQLLLKTWDMFRDEAKMAKLSFDTSVRMKFEVLQVVNDDIYIIRRDHQHPGMPYTFLTVHILFRLQTPEGFTLCFRSIPASKIQKSLEPHEIWFDVFHWSHFNHIRNEDGVPVGCEVVTGGSIGDPTMLVARHWLFELIISVLRWESSCVNPLFIKF